MKILVACEESQAVTIELRRLGDTAIRQQETVTNRNEPLTMDELRKMDGEPVWVQFLNHAVGYWDISNCHNSEFFKFCRSGFLLIDEYGKTWLAYRQQPAEEDDHES